MSIQPCMFGPLPLTPHLPTQTTTAQYTVNSTAATAFLSSHSKPREHVQPTVAEVTETGEACTIYSNHNCTLFMTLQLLHKTTAPVIDSYCLFRVSGFLLCCLCVACLSYTLTHHTFYLEGVLLVGCPAFPVVLPLH